jgi:hypothetical protein
MCLSNSQRPAQLTPTFVTDASLPWIFGRDGPYPGRAVLVAHERIVSVNLAGLRGLSLQPTEVEDRCCHPVARLLCLGLKTTFLLFEETKAKFCYRFATQPLNDASAAAIAGPAKSKLSDRRPAPQRPGPKALNHPTCRQSLRLPKHRLNSRILQVRRKAVLA